MAVLGCFWGYCVQRVWLKRGNFGVIKFLRMDFSVSGTKYTIGQLLLKFRMAYRGKSSDLYSALRTSSSTYLKVERGERELSFLMALRVCQFYKLDLHEFISMLSDQELNRQDFAAIQAQLKREKKKAEAAKARVIDIKTSEVIPEIKLS
jgi:hypothetical protein